MFLELFGGGNLLFGVFAISTWVREKKMCSPSKQHIHIGINWYALSRSMDILDVMKSLFCVSLAFLWVEQGVFVWGNISYHFHFYLECTMFRLDIPNIYLCVGRQWVSLPTIIFIIFKPLWFMQNNFEIYFWRYTTKFLRYKSLKLNSWCSLQAAYTSFSYNCRMTKTSPETVDGFILIFRKFVAFHPYTSAVDIRIVENDFSFSNGGIIKSQSLFEKKKNSIIRKSNWIVIAKLLRVLLWRVPTFFLMPSIKIKYMLVC